MAKSRGVFTRTGHRRVRVLRDARGKRRCYDCGKNISERGHRALRCEKCAKTYLVKWRKKYDALPENIQQRREYDSKPKNVRKAKGRRNKKIYLLGLCIRVLRLDGQTIDLSIDHMESKLRKAGRKPPIAKKILRGEALSVAQHPWSTVSDSVKAEFVNAISKYSSLDLFAPAQ